MRNKRASRQLEKLIEQLGLPTDYEEKETEYGSVYYGFTDGTVVMKKDQLETFVCETEQSWFWNAFQYDSLSDWQLSHLDQGASWKNDGENIIDYIIDDVVSEITYGVGAVHRGSSLQDTYNNIFGVDIDVAGIQVDPVDFFEEGWDDSGYLVLTDDYILGDFLAANGFNDWAREDIADYAEVLALFNDIDNKLGAQSSKLYTLMEKSVEQAAQAILLAETLLGKEYSVDSEDVHVLSSIRELLSDIATKSISSVDVDEFYDWVYDQVKYQLSDDNVFSTFIEIHHNADSDWREFVDLNEYRINDSICDGLEAGMDAFENAYFADDKKHTMQVGDWFVASNTDYSKSNRRASMSKKANWWNTTIVFDYGTDFRLHIGAEQSFSSGSSSLNYILSNSMPRVKRETYEPIIDLLLSNSDIGLYKPSSFDELHMDSKRKSVILGWSLSGVKPRNMDLYDYLKSNGIKGYIVKG